MGLFDKFKKKRKEEKPVEEIKEAEELKAPGLGCDYGDL